MEITGKTLHDIGETAYPVPGDFMLLGSIGTKTRYTTKKAALSAISAEIAANVYRKIPGDVAQKIDELSSKIYTDGELYVRKMPVDSTITQDVNSNLAVYGGLSVSGDVDLNQKAECRLIMPERSYIGGTASADAAATQGYVDDAVYGLSVQVQPVEEQILDMDWGGYASLTAVCKRPYIYNSQYGLDGGSAGNFYKYDGIRRDCSLDIEDDDRAGYVYVAATGYMGVPLTTPYTDFKTLTFVTVAATNAASEALTAFTAKDINIITVPVSDIEIARRYKEYLSRYQKISDKSMFLENANFHWLLGSSVNGPRIGIKVSSRFYKDQPGDCMFVPFFPGSNGYAVAAVYGRK